LGLLKKINSTSKERIQWMGETFLLNKQIVVPNPRALKKIEPFLLKKIEPFNSKGDFRKRIYQQII